MGFFGYMRDCLARVLSRKKTLLLLGGCFLLFTVLGACFAKTPAVYEYHLRICERFLDRVCYSSRNVFLIFTERFAGDALILILISAAGIHTAALAVPAFVLAYRAYLFGGTLAVLFTVYGFPGAMIAIVFYLPVRLLTDAVFLAATALASGRGRGLCRDFKELLLDSAVFLLLILAVCLVELLLLVVLFHTPGNLV